MDELPLLNYHIASIDELKQIAKEILDKAYSKIVLLNGELGAGKTAFVKAFCEVLDCEDEVSSPTFSIVNEYRNDTQSVFHIDLYRLESIDEALEIGIEEYMDGYDYCFIEWPNLIRELIRIPVVIVNIESIQGNSRKLLISFE
jgi:tRNA threonylcarbamoyladenosine biosynthesis protein TsaE